MEYLSQLLQVVLHLDHYLLALVAHYGVWVYALVFAIIFCETGLIIFPFLPGDSLLFTLGSIAAQPLEPLNIFILLLSLVIASLLGNHVNFWIGHQLGSKILASRSRLINKRYLEEAHQFYQKHGGQTIILARFIPIIRTFAPFVAGMGHMSVTKFYFYNSCSAILWIGSLLSMGYFLGSLPFIRAHFTMVIYGIILISLLPPMCSFIYHQYQLRKRFLAPERIEKGP